MEPPNWHLVTEPNKVTSSESHLLRFRHSVSDFASWTSTAVSLSSVSGILSDYCVNASYLKCSTSTVLFHTVKYNWIPSLYDLPNRHYHNNTYCYEDVMEFIPNSSDMWRTSYSRTFILIEGVLLASSISNTSNNVYFILSHNLLAPLVIHNIQWCQMVSLDQYVVKEVSIYKYIFLVSDVYTLTTLMMGNH